MTLASVQASSRPAQAPGNEACESRQVKPKETPNHPEEPGQGKTDRVNVSEPLLRLRHRRSPKMMVGHHGDDRAYGRQAAPAAAADTTAPRYRRHPTPSRLTSAEHGNPVAVWPTGQ